MDVNQKVQAYVAQSIGTLWLEVQRQMVLAETYEQEVKRLRAALHKEVSASPKDESEQQQSG